jgi:hypothetical protein
MIVVSVYVLKTNDFIFGKYFIFWDLKLTGQFMCLDLLIRWNFKNSFINCWSPYWICKKISYILLSVSVNGASSRIKHTQALQGHYDTWLSKTGSLEGHIRRMFRMQSSLGHNKWEVITTLCRSFIPLKYDLFFYSNPWMYWCICPTLAWDQKITLQEKKNGVA